MLLGYFALDGKGGRWLKFFKDMERFFENHIEGFFRRRLATGIQPVEIAQKLVRAMEDNLQVSVTTTYAPNHYTIRLHPEDIKRMQSLEISLAGELSQYILRHAERQKVKIVGVPRMEMQEDGAVPLGDVRVETGFIPEEGNQDARAQQAEHHQGTQVFEGVKISGAADARHKAVPCALLRASTGVDAGKEWELGCSRMYIGRRQTNEIPLNDINASRVHAYIAMDAGRHVLHDAKSLNGTYVNEERILHKILCSGDRIRIGHSILVYEVM